MTLKELKLYWSKKYPTILITLWEDAVKGIYVGRLQSNKEQSVIKSDSIGDLISQGESFLRRNL